MAGNYIFLADDDIDDQDMLKEALLGLNAGLKFKTAGNGRQAVEFLTGLDAASVPSLIILDYKMPMLSAVDILEQIKTDERYKNVPRVVWSTSKQPEHINKCLSAGACDYFVKPPNAAALGELARLLLALLPH